MRELSLFCLQNAYYYQNRSLLNNAKDLAAKKDIVALEALSHTEVCPMSFIVLFQFFNVCSNASGIILLFSFFFFL